MLSALTFLAGGLLTYVVSFNMDISFLIPFAAGNFLYIGASDLVPEIRGHKDPWGNITNFISFLIGVSLMLIIKVILGS
jgi:zinc and cadmium transporter